MLDGECPLGVFRHCPLLRCPKTFSSSQSVGKIRKKKKVLKFFLMEPRQKAVGLMNTIPYSFLTFSTLSKELSAIFVGNIVPELCLQSW